MLSDKSIKLNSGRISISMIIQAYNCGRFIKEEKMN